MIRVQAVLQWFAHNPLAGAGVVYAATILGVISYAYIFKRQLLEE
jgi:hypothetical protein